MEANEHTTVTREYELAFLAISAEQATGVFAAVEKAGGTLTYRGTPVSIRLAYAIKKQTAAFFTFCTFAADSARVGGIKAALDQQSDILRYLMITPPSRQVSQPPRVSPAGPGELPGGENTPTLTNEALEQKLEEILK